MDSIDRRRTADYQRTAKERVFTTRWYAGAEDEDWGSRTTGRRCKPLGSSPNMTRSCTDISSWTSSQRDPDNGGFESSSRDCMSEFGERKLRKPGRIRKLFGSLKNLRISRSQSLRFDAQRKDSNLSTTDSYRSKDSIEEVDEEYEIDEQMVNDGICPYQDASSDGNDNEGDDIIPYNPNGCIANDEIYPYNPISTNEEIYPYPIRSIESSSGINSDVTISDDDGMGNDDQIYPINNKQVLQHERYRPLQQIGQNDISVYMVI